MFMDLPEDKELTPPPLQIELIMSKAFTRHDVISHHVLKFEMYD